LKNNQYSLERWCSCAINWYLYWSRHYIELWLQLLEYIISNLHDDADVLLRVVSILMLRFIQILN